MSTLEEGRRTSLVVWTLCALWLTASTNCEDLLDLFDSSTVRSNNQKDDISMKDTRNAFSPRMDYEQWTPLGRGDPLKNDPTYDYVPPVLERVHYWIDPASRKPDPSLPGETSKKTEILVLGVSSKKPSTAFSAADSRTGSFDSFMKFVTGPSFGNFPLMQRPQYSVSQPYYPNYYKKHEKDEHRVPYTMLMPPPMPNRSQDNIPYMQPTMSSTSTTTPASASAQVTTSSISIDESNLVYHSSSVSTADEWKGSNTYATLAEPSSLVTWRTPLQYPKNGTLIPIGSTSTFALVDTDVVVGAPERGMHKGQVSDDTLDPGGTYVSIGKPDAQVQPATGMGMDSISIGIPPLLPTKSTFVIPSMNSMYRKPQAQPQLQPIPQQTQHVQQPRPQSQGQTPPKKSEIPMTLQNMHTLETMQTMQPPPVTDSMPQKPPESLLHSLLVKEMNGLMSTTPPPPPSTSVASLTTDPLFKHYKQPVEPIRGPLYLIIQGHSKVKTYGPSKQSGNNRAHETNEIQTEDRPTESEFQVKHLHEYLRDTKEARERDRREGKSIYLESLDQVVASGVGAISEAEIAEELRAERREDDIREAELVVQYDVSADSQPASEVYHKGIVESERLPFPSQSVPVPPTDN